MPHEDPHLPTITDVARKLREDMQQAAQQHTEDPKLTWLKIKACFSTILLETQTESGNWRGFASREYIRELAEEGLELIERVGKCGG